jgi:hypothetical protein
MILDKIYKQHEKIKYWDKICRHIAPPALTEHKDHVMIGEDITKVILVGRPLEKVAGWPSGLSPSFMDQLLDIGCNEHITISITSLYIPIPPDKSVELYNQSVLKLSTNKKKSENSNEQRIAERFIDIRRDDMYDEAGDVIRGNKRQFHTAFIITIHATNEAEMRTAMSHIKSVLGAHYIQNEPPECCMLEVLESSLLTSATCDYIWTEQLTDTAVKVAPLKNPNSRMDDKGLLFGIDTKTKKDIIIDLSRLPAQHATVLAPTGAGKTYTLLMLLMRACSSLGYRTVYTTPKPDAKTAYKKVAEAFGDGAAVIELGPGKSTLNPLQVFYDEDISHYTPEGANRLMDDHKELVYQFFKVRLGNEMSSNMETLLDRTLTAVYKKNKIVQDDIKTWDNANWPVMTDLIDYWEDLRKEDKDKDGTAKALINKTFKFKGAWSFMNRQTDIDLTRNFLIVDFSSVPASLSDSMNVLITGILGQRLKTAVDRPSIICIDEGRVFLKNQELGDFIIKMFTQGRSSDCALWLSLLQIADLAGVSDEIATNTFIEIILGSNLKKSSIDAIKNHYKLDDESVRTLISADVGQGIIIKDGFATPITFKSTAFEDAVIKGKLEELDKPDTITVNEAVADIARENGIYFDNWLSGGSIHTLNDMAYEQLPVQKIDGRGTIKTWIRKGKISGSMVGNQSVDHYCAVCQLAGALSIAGFKTEINHFNDADVIARNNGNTYAFEYEHPGSHTRDNLVDKDERHTKNYGNVFFVCSGGNYEQVKDAVGEAKTVKRGIQIKNLIDKIKPEVN